LILNHYSRIKKKNTRIKFAVKSFSDTIIITAKENSIEKVLTELGSSMSLILMTGLSYGLFLRGCISIGDFIESENMIIGPAVDEAAKYYELFNWIGVSATPSAYSVLHRLSEQGIQQIDQFFIKYDIPTKNGIVKNQIAIILHPRIKFSDAYLQTDFEDTTMKEFVQKQLEHPVDASAGEKWKNTFDFLLYIEEHFPTKIRKKLQS